MRSQVYRGFPGERESGLNRKYVRVTFPETDTAMPGMGQRRINDLEPKRIPEGSFAAAPLHENSCQTKPAEGESSGNHIRTEDTER